MPKINKMKQVPYLHLRTYGIGYYRNQDVGYNHYKTHQISKTIERRPYRTHGFMEKVEYSPYRTHGLEGIPRKRNAAPIQNHPTPMKAPTPTKMSQIKPM